MPYISNNSSGTLSPTAVPEPPREPRKLVLCFDGTGNEFSGSNADTNVVKILNKLDRNDPNQFHYYQTGIGTYDLNEQSVNKTWLGELRSSISKTIDQAVGTTFDAHVMAGYRFLMRYYDSGDKIYMFGFSRGAFTAKFLARMIHTVGLLCKGNEEMVPFAFRLYQRYLAGEIEDYMVEREIKKAQEDASGCPPADGEEELLAPPLAAESALDDEGSPVQPRKKKRHGRKFKKARNEITAFSNTFCRKEKIIRRGKEVESNIKVYFLGIWDCVNSVAVLERKTPVPVPVKGTAHYVRHAVAIDERRVKFKPALLAQDVRCKGSKDEDIKEVWFPGCHGDVGGGWPAEEDDAHETASTMSIWQRIKSFWTTDKAKEASHDVAKDPFQMSDLALAWMIREVEIVGQKDPAAAVKWCNSVNGFKRRFKKRKEQALRGRIHDSLQFSSGTGFFTVLLWHFMEWFPLITRWELSKNTWVNVRFPLNKGWARDIPKDAVFHHSVCWRLENDANYHPTNNHGDNEDPCLRNNGIIREMKPVTEHHDTLDLDHQTFVFASQL